MKPLKNIPASVLARLKNIAREQGRDFNFLVNLYCRERFLYRLGVSKYKNNLLLKGGLLLLNAVDSLVRPTKDIDVLGMDISNDISSLKAIVSEICSVDAEDGVTFDLQDLTGEEITKAGGYPGIRLKFKAFIGKSWFPMQIDFGFGDIVVPEPVEFEYRTLLDFPPPTHKSILVRKRYC